MRGWACRLQLLLVLASAVIHKSESRGNHDNILLSQIRDSPNLGEQATVFSSPRNRVARLYIQALGSLLVASYDSQGYGGGIRPRLHTGYCLECTNRLLFIIATRPKYKSPCPIINCPLLCCMFSREYIC
jgi:hypothetical protein